MGKKKDKRARHGQDAQRAAKGGAAPIMGIAATLVRQLDTPAGRQVIAAGLMAAASAIAAKDARTGGARPAGPVPPTPPAPPESPDRPEPAGTSPFAGRTPEPPRSDAPALPPEVAKVIGSVTAGLERWAAAFGTPKAPVPPKP